MDADWVCVHALNGSPRFVCLRLKCRAALPLLMHHENGAWATLHWRRPHFKSTHYLRNLLNKHEFNWSQKGCCCFSFVQILKSVLLHLFPDSVYFEGLHNSQSRHDKQRRMSHISFSFCDKDVSVFLDVGVCTRAYSMCGTGPALLACVAPAAVPFPRIHSWGEPWGRAAAWCTSPYPLFLLCFLSRGPSLWQHMQLHSDIPSFITAAPPPPPPSPFTTPDTDTNAEMLWMILMYSLRARSHQDKETNTSHQSQR